LGLSQLAVKIFACSIILFHRKVAEIL